jgi:1,2-beta-oligoglucan phosphorylase
MIMPHSSMEQLVTPRIGDLDRKRIANAADFSISLLPSGALFAMEHEAAGRRIMINQTLASPLADGMARMFLRVRGGAVSPIIGPATGLRLGVGEDRIVWEGERDGAHHRVTLWLHPRSNVWLWRVEIANRSDRELACDAVLVQDLGLGDPGFLMNNEAYACQYMDHHVAGHPRMGPVLMSRQNLSQGGAFPWAAHGCLEGSAGYATDFRQIIGPESRDADGLRLAFGEALPCQRLQYETACAALQSSPATLAPGAAANWTFFGAYEPDHSAASSDADLSIVDIVEQAARDFAPRPLALSDPTRSLLHIALSATADPLDKKAIAARYRRRMHEERAQGELLSFFTPGRTRSRHVVLRDKERIVPRRHGALLRSGDAMLPDDDLLCATCWMHGVFGAQLTIGNTSFHKLFSVSRDPYNITRASGLRMLVEIGKGWRLLTVPSAFEMGLSDCRWIYRLGTQTITVETVVAGDEPAMQWRVSVEGKPCRLLIFGQLVLGEREFSHGGRVEIDARRRQFAFRPDPDDRWGRQYPDAVYHLVTSTPRRVEAIGGDELLYLDGKRRSGGYAVIRTKPTKEFVFAVVGSMTDPARAKALASKYAEPVDDATMLAPADRFWRKLTRGVRVESRREDADAKAFDTIVPWLAHDAMIHLTVPHGLEQYTGGAWGTRDVCQGPLEFLLTFEHDASAKDILRILFAQQYEKRGDWPQWFMLDPYADVQDREAHGDVVVWPLKALCDYVEATGDFAFLDEAIAWRREDDFKRTDHADTIGAHIDKLFATVEARFVTGTHLIRYGNGDWNDSLQPVDPTRRDWMVSSWTVALLYEQLRRYAEILRRVGRASRARVFDASAAAMRKDFNGLLIRDRVVAGYGVFSPRGGAPELLLHPSDTETGLSFSLLPMTQGIIGGIFTKQEARRSLGLIRKHLLSSDGARLMEKPIAYHGGPERIFRRAESAAFFGREIGLMYTHSHLRYAEAMSDLGESDALWEALIVANPIAVTDRLSHASLRQRNAYFSSSDAAFHDRYQASAEWARVRADTIPVDGGWRVYSSGPGLYTNILIRHMFGIRRDFGRRLLKPCLAPSHKGVKLVWRKPVGGLRQR